MVIRPLNPFLLTRTSTSSRFFENQPRTLWLASRRLQNSSKFFMKLSLQKALEIFLGVARSHPWYLEGPPTSGLCNASTLMVIRPLNHFLFRTQFNPPVAHGFGNRFFICQITLFFVGLPDLICQMATQKNAFFLASKGTV